MSHTDATGAPELDRPPDEEIHVPLLGDVERVAIVGAQSTALDEWVASSSRWRGEMGLPGAHTQAPAHKQFGQLPSVGTLSPRRQQPQVFYRGRSS
jgi:hypothetical protein